ncbi:MAG TPA: hypothetical protein VEY09_13975 [Pyrinomonadaceae bacterium]|nr:hypothetical protein [Pyrinomonadaceae bacterium]
MNCRDFLEKMNDVARGALMDAAARAEALAHEAACGACAARLADDRALAAGLRALAARDAGLEAPPRVEAALLAAFRARRSEMSPAEAVGAEVAAAEAVGAGLAAPRVAAPSGAAEIPAPHVPAMKVSAEVSASPAARAANVASLEEARAIRRWNWTRTLATAATAAAAAVAFLMITLPGEAPPVPGGGRLAAETPRPAPAAVDATQPDAANHNPNAGELAAGPSGDSGGAATTAVVRGERSSLAPTREARLAPAASRAGATGRPSMVPAKYERGGPDRPRGFASAEAGDDEYATDFIPLPGGQAGPVVAGQLVRVELPRSALSRFGLPVTAESTGERVKADVLLGEDGMARAIRFVR